VKLQTTQGQLTCRQQLQVYVEDLCIGQDLVSEYKAKIPVAASFQLKDSLAQEGQGCGRPALQGFHVAIIKNRLPRVPAQAHKCQVGQLQQRCERAPDLKSYKVLRRGYGEGLQLRHGLQHHGHLLQHSSKTNRILSMF